MWKYKYGDFENGQIDEAKKKMRKQIYFLLLYVDPATRDEYAHVDVEKAFTSILYQFDGLNEILLYPPSMVKIISLLEEAKKEYLSDDFSFEVYRKLVLDAGNEVLNIEEVR